MACKKENVFLGILIACIFVYVVIFTVLGILKQEAFFSFDFEDETNVLQMAYNTANGNLFRQTIDFSGAWGHIFATHLNLCFLFITLPFYIISSSGKIMPFLFSLFLGFSALPLYLILRRFVFFDNLAASLMLAVSYLFYPVLHIINFSTYPPWGFGLFFVMFAFYWYLEKNFRMFIIFSILALLCREDVSFTVFMIGIYGAVSGFKGKWVYVPIILSSMWFIAALIILILTKGYAFYATGAFFVEEPIGLLNYIISKPFETLGVMFSKSHFVFWLKMLLPVIFIPIFALEFWIALPGIIFSLLMNGPIRYDSVYYLTPVIGFMFIGTGFGIKKLENIFRKKIAVFLSFIILVICILSNFGSNMICGRYFGKIYDSRYENVNNIFSPIFFRKDNDDKIALNLIRMIPKGASVSASGDLLVLLATRKKILQFGRDDKYYDYFDVDYILIHTKYMYGGFGDYSKATKDDYKKLNLLARKGVFKIIKKDGDFMLFKRQK